MNKKVIFVGGTIYSGSTFFHLTLANDPRGFAIGEAKNWFQPTDVKHRRSNLVCQCGDPDCDLWYRVERNGMNHLYETIFDLHPGVEFIVDSSKYLTWIDSQTSRLAGQGIEVKHILIWKTLIEYAYSLQKRSALDADNGKALAYWADYHQAFYSFFNDFGAVNYKNYTEEHQTTLREACNFLEIPYFEGKEQFWDKRHHSLGGNLAARIHLYSKDSSNYQDVVRRSNAGANQYDIGVSEEHHREIFYDRPDEETLQPYIARLHRNYPNLDLIGDMLTSRDVGNPDGWGSVWPSLQDSAFAIQRQRALKTIKDRYHQARFSMRYRE